MGIENSHLGQSPSSLSLEDYVLQIVRRDPSEVHRATQRHVAYGEFPALQQGFLYNTPHMIHDVRNYWRNQSYRALQYHSESKLLSKNINGSDQAVETQRHHLFQEAAAEMMPRETHNQEVVSPVRM